MARPKILKIVFVEKSKDQSVICESSGFENRFQRGPHLVFDLLKREKEKAKGSYNLEF